MINKIESRQNQRIKDLMNSKHLKENKLFKIEGFHALEMAKKSGMQTVRIFYNENSAKDKEYIDYAFKGVNAFVDELLKKVA